MGIAYINRCIQCGCEYAIDVPMNDIIHDTEMHFGICTEGCLEHYKKQYDIPNSYFNKSSIKYLKQLGHHELGDWIVRGGLEEIMQNDDDGL